MSIEAIDIISEKHGSDYHPARVALHGPKSVLSFVVNVAVDERGKQRLSEDFRLLGHLRAKCGTTFIPRAYVIGEQNSSVDQGEEFHMLMFLADWFEGFHEFHLSYLPGSTDLQHILWDLDHGYVALSAEETHDAFRQAAFILTTLYDTATFEEVFPWHHASGDFIVRRKDGKLDVRLITVRQYAARPVFAEPTAQDRVLALLLFFSNLSVRMRLDRLDGVGDIAWAGEECVRATTQGFFEAMEDKVATGHCQPELFAELCNTMQSLPLSELAALFHAVLESYDEEAPDTPVVKEHLVDHIFQIYRSLQDLDRGSG